LPCGARSGRLPRASRIWNIFMLINYKKFHIIISFNFTSRMPDVFSFDGQRIQARTTVFDRGMLNSAAQPPKQ
jgi:hypothetical protein